MQALKLEESSVPVAQPSEREQRLLKQIELLEKERSGLQEQIKQITNSTSWKVTKPLRRFFEIARKMRPLFRFSKIVCNQKEYRHVKINNQGGVEIVGTSPSLELIPNGKAYPSSWCWFSANLVTKEEHSFFTLYYTTTGEYSDGQRILLPLGDKSIQRHLVQFPHDVTGIRLDPFFTQGTFTLQNVEAYQIGKIQLAWHFFEKYFLRYVNSPAQLFSRLKKLFSILREGGLVALRMKLFASSLTNNYEDWVKRYDTLTDDDRAKIRTHCKQLSRQPLISVVMPTYNTPEIYLRRVIESVQKQLYPHWELCIADDNSSDPRVKEVLQEYANKDPRIKLCFREKNGHIAEASNSALSLAQGEFVALLDHDDELSEHALYYVAVEISQHPNAKFIYSDEDKITGFGMRFNPYFKSSWNPELLLSQNYICHLAVIERNTLISVGGWRPAYNGAQDWDLFFRVSRAVKEKQIRHIPHILYHWRVIEGSTAQSTAHKPYVLKAQQAAVADHLQALGIKNPRVEILEAIAHQRVYFPIPEPAPLVSIIIPTKDRLYLLERCVDSILDKTDYKNYEIIIVDNSSEKQETFDYFKKITAKHANIVIHRDEGPFNFSRLNNNAVKLAKGSILGFLNNDLEVISKDWLSEMVSRIARADGSAIGAVGARLYWPNNLLQHGGIILGIGGVAGHNHKGKRREDVGYFNRAILPQNLSAVTAACVLVTKQAFDAVNGFDEVNLAVAFNDTDLCLKICEAGYKIIYTPYAELYHHESASRGSDNTPEQFLRFEREIAYMKNRWGKLLLNDPYYNPNLTLLSEDFAFSFPPRTVKPWKSVA